MLLRLPLTTLTDVDPLIEPLKAITVALTVVLRTLVACPWPSVMTEVCAGGVSVPAEVEKTTSWSGMRLPFFDLSVAMMWAGRRRLPGRRRFAGCAETEMRFRRSDGVLPMHVARTTRPSDTEAATRRDRRGPTCGGGGSHHVLVHRELPPSESPLIVGLPSNPVPSAPLFTS